MKLKLIITTFFILSAISIYYLFSFFSTTPKQQYLKDISNVPLKSLNDFTTSSDETIINDLPNNDNDQRSINNVQQKNIEIKNSKKIINKVEVEVEVEEEIILDDKEVVIKKDLPKQLNLDVPFTSQAPQSDWSQPWQDACEEAAVLMLKNYYSQKEIKKDDAIVEILKMVSWQEKQEWGSSIEAAKVKQLLQFQISNFPATAGQAKFQILNKPTVADIKKSVAMGNPVLVLADGKTLDNPHFSNGGPVYHALIVRGYTETHFITNDPGTRWGENFKYTYDNLMSSIHDWNDGDVKNGEARVIVVE